jgi:hypothetical protein
MKRMWTIIGVADVRGHVERSRMYTLRQKQTLQRSFG